MITHVITKGNFGDGVFDCNILNLTMWKVRLSSEIKTLTSELKVKIGGNHFDFTNSYAPLRTLVVKNDTTVSSFLGFGYHSGII